MSYLKNTHQCYSSKVSPGLSVPNRDVDNVLPSSLLSYCLSCRVVSVAVNEWQGNDELRNSKTKEALKKPTFFCFVLFDS